MMLITKIKRGLFKNIPPTKRYLIPLLQKFISLQSAETRPGDGRTRDGRRGKYSPREEDAKHDYLMRFPQWQGVQA